MPTNFTVVPVEDAEGGSNCPAEAASNKTSNLGKMFVVEEDGENSQEQSSGIVKPQTIVENCLNCKVSTVENH